MNIIEVNKMRNKLIGMLTVVSIVMLIGNVVSCADLDNILSMYPDDNSTDLDNDTDTDIDNGTDNSTDNSSFSLSICLDNQSIDISRGIDMGSYFTKKVTIINKTFVAPIITNIVTDEEIVIYTPFSNMGAIHELYIDLADNRSFEIDERLSNTCGNSKSSITLNQNCSFHLNYTKELEKGLVDNISLYSLKYPKVIIPVRGDKFKSILSINEAELGKIDFEDKKIKFVNLSNVGTLIQKGIKIRLLKGESFFIDNIDCVVDCTILNMNDILGIKLSRHIKPAEVSDELIVEDADNENKELLRVLLVGDAGRYDYLIDFSGGDNLVSGDNITTRDDIQISNEDGTDMIAVEGARFTVRKRGDFDLTNFYVKLASDSSFEINDNGCGTATAPKTLGGLVNSCRITIIYNSNSKGNSDESTLTFYSDNIDPRVITIKLRDDYYR